MTRDSRPPRETRHLAWKSRARAASCDISPHRTRHWVSIHGNKAQAPAEAASRCGPDESEPGLFSIESVLKLQKSIFADCPLAEVLTNIAQLVEAQAEARFMAEGLKSGCDLPLIGRSGVRGVLGALKRSDRAFEKEDVDFLEHQGRDAD